MNGIKQGITFDSGISNFVVVIVLNRVMDMTQIWANLRTNRLTLLAMDTPMIQEGDVWNPDESCVAKARSMCRHISRILKSGGFHLQISVHQIHFRKKYLLGWHGAAEDVVQKEGCSDELNWSFRVETIGGDGECFQNFLYIMRNSDYSSTGTR
jgi:hypothetical protein